jgi:hypothetical protein
VTVEGTAARHPMSYDANQKVQQIITDVAKLSGLPTVRLLNADGQVLDPKSTLKAAGIGDGSTIQLVTKWLDPDVDTDVKLSSVMDPCSSETAEGNPRAEMPCGHAFTPETLTQFARSYISVNLRSEISCPMEKGCDKKGIIPYKLFVNAAKLTSEERKFFDRKISENFLESRAGLNIIKCINCKSFCFLDDPKLVRVACQACELIKKESFEFCSRCLRKWNSSSLTDCGHKDCKTIWVDNLVPLLDKCATKKIGGVAMVPTFRACPSASHLEKGYPVVLEHKEACKHFKCPVCEVDFCWVCLLPKKDGEWQCGKYDAPCTVAQRQTLNDYVKKVKGS